MVLIRHASALAAATFFSMASAQSWITSSVQQIPTPTATVPASALTSIGCFSTGIPLADHGEGYFNSAGSCQQICLGLKKPVLGLSDGTHCWCGDELPPKSAQIANSSCDTSCNGIDTEDCGGPGNLWIVLTGFTRNRVDNYDPNQDASSSSSKSPAAQTSEVPQTVVETATSAPSQASKDGGPNKVGIAVGVVVGVLALAAIVGGVFFFLRQKRRREVEEEYRRQAAVNSFVSGGKLHTSNSSMTDSRLDPEFMARRASTTGLIAAAAAGGVIGLTFVLFGIFTANCNTNVALKQLWIIPLATMAGLCGSLIDSLLGATVQFSGFCTVRNKVVEKPGPTVKRISGTSILDNNGVNLVSILLTTLLTSIACLYLF